MEHDAMIADDGLLKMLGERLAGVRLARNLTQAEVADQAGLGLRTVQRMELGELAVQMSSFVRVCRVLGLLDRLESLVPEATPGPVQLAKLHGKRRKRASGTKAAATRAKPWTWGESP